MTSGQDPSRTSGFGGPQPPFLFSFFGKGWGSRVGIWGVEGGGARCKWKVIKENEDVR